MSYCEKSIGQGTTGMNRLTGLSPPYPYTSGGTTSRQQLIVLWLIQSLFYGVLFCFYFMNEL